MKTKTQEQQAQKQQKQGDTLKVRGGVGGLVVLQGHSRREYVINRVRGTRDAIMFMTRMDLKNHCSRVLIGIRHRYHKIHEFEQ